MPQPGFIRVLDLSFIDLLRRLVNPEGSEDHPYTNTSEDQAKESQKENRTHFRLLGSGLLQSKHDTREANSTEGKHEQYDEEKADSFGECHHFQCNQ